MIYLKESGFKVCKKRIPLTRKAIESMACGLNRTNVDMFTGNRLQDRILRKITGKRLSLKRNKLGMLFHTHRFDGFNLHVFGEQWFDDYNNARKKRGWPPVALILNYYDKTGLLILFQEKS